MTINKTVIDKIDKNTCIIMKGDLNEISTIPMENNKAAGSHTEIGSVYKYKLET